MRRALLIYGDLARGVELKGALRAVVDEVCLVATIFDADVGRAWDLIVMDLDTLDADEHPMFLGMLAPCVARGRLILMGAELSASLLELFVAEVGFLNLLRKGASDEIAHLVATARKLGSQEIFGLQKYLRWGGRVMRLAVPLGGPPELALRWTETFVEDLGASHDLARRFLLAATALIQDSLPGGPRPDEKRAGLELLEVTLGFDGTTLGISVIEPGGMPAEETLRRLVGDGLLDRPPHGGPASAPWLALRGASHLIFNVAPEERSERIALFDSRDGAGARRSTPQSLHLFSQ